ncbi:hypothetical protein Q8A67_007145 [Cirrhinus molitorella]|uniref:AMP-binding enzyme C-terminal domain-containing protein n=1 Tax=Cirrhinus molitorella TaxID=172907 RepID=A0AA88Q5X8_9TELE|nr:hypothetical protein Q8A67_007145 [Cirrhinus molitorella]
MEMCTKGLGSQTEALWTCMVVAEERPCITLMQSFSNTKYLGLSSWAVSTIFGCRVNVAICLQILPGVKVIIANTETKGPLGDSHTEDETMELRGMRYHHIDIETSVIRSHKSIAECAVFTWTNLLVVVVELEGSEQEALALVALVTNVVLEEHYLIVAVIVVVDPESSLSTPEERSSTCTCGMASSPTSWILYMWPTT